jgi:hypothetical protein
MTIKRSPSTRTPAIDRVITRNFRFVARTDQTPTNAQDCLLANAKDQWVSDSICLRLSNIPGVTNFKSIYTHFRFDKCTFRFIPLTVTAQVDDTDTGTSASSISKCTPKFYVGTRVWGNEVPSDFTWELENSALIDSAKTCKMTRGTSITWVPNTLTPVQTSRATSGTQVFPATTGWMPLRKKWHSLRDDNILWYGLKYGISSTSSDQNEYLYKVIVSAKISFKGKADSNYTQSAGGGTVLIPITQQT